MKSVQILAAGFSIALIVYIAIFSLYQDQVFLSVFENWQVTVTMVFGSLIAGLTSEGGGAVAFPVFTKILHIPPQEARMFSLAIQSIGMTCASALIIFMRVRVVWSVIAWVSLGGLAGMIFSSTYILPLVSPLLIKVGFTALVTSLAITLILINTRGYDFKRQSINIRNHRQKIFFVTLGCLGGLVSGLVGNGIDIMTFSVLVLMFRLSEKVSTPTSVILMAINAIIGFIYNAVVLDHFTPVVEGYWLAAIPVVVIGAPLGAFICTHMNRKMISWFLIFLITIELISTIIILPITVNVGLIATAMAILLSIFYTFVFLNPFKIKI